MQVETSKSPRDINLVYRELCRPEWLTIRWTVDTGKGVICGASGEGKARGGLQKHTPQMSSLSSKSSTRCDERAYVNQHLHSQVVLK